MRFPFSVRFRLSTALALCALSPLAGAAPTSGDELADLRRQVQALAEQLRQVERRLAERERAETAAAAPAPVSAAALPPVAPAAPVSGAAPARVSITDRGFSFTSADGDHALKVRGLIQADARVFFGSDAADDTFVLRRGRFAVEGNFHQFLQFQIVPEFGGSSLNLQDAHLTVALRPEAQVRVGRFKSPIGLEQLQSDSWAFFAERSLATNLVPSRDVGLVLTGDVATGRVNYTVGLMNGAPDAGSAGNSDAERGKEWVGRVFVQPFKAEETSPWRGLGVGVGGSYGGRNRTAAPLTTGYRSDGQQRIFAYGPTVVADGEAWRLSPQAHLYQGPLGVLLEYVMTSVDVRAGASSDTLQHRAWQLAAGYVVTGEAASFNGVVPARPFRPNGEGWGAFEVVARVAELDLDEATFPRFAAPTTQAQQARSYGVGLNWYLTRLIRASFDYLHTDFDTTLEPTSVLLGDGERVFISRLQLAF